MSADALSVFLPISCVLPVPACATISDLIDADFFHQLCLHLPWRPHCSVHPLSVLSTGDRLVLLKRARPCHSSAEIHAMAPYFSQRKSQSTRCPAGPLRSSFLLPPLAGPLLLSLALTLFQPREPACCSVNMPDLRALAPSPGSSSPRYLLG